MTFDWQTTFAQAIEGFGGDTPGAQLELDIRNSFLEHPQAVTNAIRKIAQGYASGRIHSPWGALKAEIPKQIAGEATVGDGSEKKRAIANTEQWMRNAGMHYDRWTEVHAHVFGSTGNLHTWRHDPKLGDRIEELWEAVRPIGEQLDHEELARAQAWQEAQARIAAMPKVPTPKAAPAA